MSIDRKTYMDELAQKLLQEYLATKEQPYKYEIPLVWKGTTLSTGENAVVVIYTVRTAIPAEKAAGLPARSEIPRCPTCGKPYG